MFFKKRFALLNNIHHFSAKSFSFTIKSFFTTTCRTATRNQNTLGLRLGSSRFPVAVRACLMGEQKDTQVPRSSPSVLVVVRPFPGSPSGDPWESVWFPGNPWGFPGCPLGPCGSLGDPGAPRVPRSHYDPRGSLGVPGGPWGTRKLPWVRWSPLASSWDPGA